MKKPEEKKIAAKNGGEFFIPVDYETYAKWMAERQNQKLPSPINPPVMERVMRLSTEELFVSWTISSPHIFTNLFHHFFHEYYYMEPDFGS